jgi:hypothetical protein
MAPFARIGRAAAVASLALGLGAGTASAHDARAEYFVGDDPGVGLAMPLPLAGAGALETALLNVPGPAGGSARIGIRARDAEDVWGLTTFRRVYWLKPDAATGLGYEWLGQGATGNVSVPAGGAGTATLPSPDATLGQRQRLRVSPQSGDFVGFGGQREIWSRGGGTGPVRLGYRLDGMPGPAVGTFVDLPTATGGALALDLGAPAAGFHTLHLLVTDATGATTRSRRFLHVMPGAVATLRGLGYAWKTEAGAPLLGGFVVVPLTRNTTSQSVVLTKPAAIVQQDYTLVLNLAPADGAAGFGQTATVRLGSEYDEWTALHLPGYPVEQTAELADPDEDGVVNLLEYAFGLLPWNRESAPPYTVESLALSGSDGLQFCELRFQYRQRRGGTGATGVDYAAGGVRYRVELSTNLVYWVPHTAMPGVTPYLYSYAGPDGFDEVSLTLHVWDVLADSARGKVFGRLVIEPVE